MKRFLLIQLYKCAIALCYVGKLITGPAMKKEPGCCWVVSIKLCDHLHLTRHTPKGCIKCEMLDYMIFDTIEQANEAYFNNTGKKRKNSKK